MLQLPPKRRQIIRLLLKKSDMISAKAVVREMNICTSENSVDEGGPLQFYGNFKALASTECKHFIYFRQTTSF